MDTAELMASGEGLLWVVLGVVLLVVARFLYGVLMPYKVTTELVVKNNPAAGLAFIGYLIGVGIIYVGAVMGPKIGEIQSLEQVAMQMLIVAAYTLGGAVALGVGMFLVDRLVLIRFSVRKELIEDRNVGTAAVVAGCSIATALVIAGAVHGEGGGWWTALAFYGLGQLALIVFAWIYQWVTSYDLHEQIERDNVAAGTAFGLSIVALGVILLRAVAGDMVSWQENLMDFGYYAVLGFVLLVVLQKIADWALLPGASLHREISEDRNLNAAWVEGGFALAVSAMVFVLL